MSNLFGLDNEQACELTLVVSKQRSRAIASERLLKSIGLAKLNSVRSDRCQVGTAIFAPARCPIALSSIVELLRMSDQPQRSSFESLETMSARPESTPNTRSTDSVPELLESRIEFTELELHETGGLGIVCKAVDKNLNRTVAIKLIRDKGAADTIAAQQFAVEAEITSRLDHPGVVPVFVAGTSVEGKPFYVMRFIEGNDLAEVVDQFYQQANPTFDGLAFREMLQQFVSVCKTIAYAHNRGIIHRDIKPQNIRVGRFGETVVLDWGLATVIARSDQFRDSGESTLILSSGNSQSSSSSGAGTPAYMSPEQLSGLAATPASDIYSLGATLYKIITGHSVVDDLPGPNTRESLIEGRWKKPRERQPSLPKSLAAICEKCLAHRPNDRYPTAMSLAEDIERFLANLAVSCYEETPAEKLGRFVRKHQQWVRHAAAGLVILAVCSVVTAVYMLQLANNNEQRRAEAESQRAEAARAQLDATRSKRESLLLAARLAARSIASEIELRGAILREEAASPTLKKLVAALNADPQASEEREQLNQWLRDRYLARVTAALPTSSWCVYSMDGTQIARVAPRDSGDSNLSLGKNFRHRDYFHANGEDFEESSSEAASARPHSFEVHVSANFLSSNTKRLSTAFTVPIYTEEADGLAHTPIGILFASVQLNRMDLLPNSILVDTRTDHLSGDAMAGLILRHPDIGEMEKNAPNYARLPADTLQQIRSMKMTFGDRSSDISAIDTGFLEYIDPITQKPTVAAVESVVLANQEEHRDVGWIVLLRDASAVETPPTP